MAKTQTLSFPQGASYLIPFQCRSRGSTPANYTGWKILFVVKKNLTDGDDAALINQLIVPASDTGYNELLLNGDETYEFPVGRYYYQAVVVDATGTVGKSEVGLFVVEETTLRSNAGTYVGPNPPLNPPATAGLIFNARQPIYLDITLITSSGMSAAIYDPQHIQADAFARVNHTGTQAISTVSGLQAALDANSSAISSHITNTSNPHAVTKAQVGLANVDNTADAAKNVLSATKLTTPRTINGVSFDGTGNITITDSTKEPTIGVGTTAQYWRGDKTWQTLNKSAVGLGSVDNTSDADKPASTAVQTALNGKATLLNIPQYALPYRNAAGSGEPNTNLLVASGSAVAGTVAMRDGAGAIHAATATAGTHAVNKTQMDASDADHVAAADPHPQYHNDARGDARYAGQPYAVMAKSQFASLSSSYGTLGRIFGNDGYKNDLQVYGLSTQAGTPTPDVPIPIVSTTGNARVNSSSKNRIIMNRAGHTAYGVTLTPNDDGSVTLNGTSTANWIWYPNIDSSQNIFMPAGSVFTMSGLSGGSPTTYYFELHFALSNGTTQYRALATGPTVTYTQSFDGVAAAYLAVKTGAVFNNLTVYPQVEMGLVATAFEKNTNSTQTLPLGTTQLRSLPNGVSDRIYKDGSTWKLEQNVASVTLNGSEAWLIHIEARPAHITFRLTMPTLQSQGPYLIATLPNALADRFTSISWRSMNDDAFNTEATSVHNVASTMYFTIARSRLATEDIAGFKAWVSANNITTIYQLLTPVTTTITDPTLITALENIRTYRGVTNITASTPVSGSYGLDLTKTLAGKVDTTGDQTIAGVKTFTSAPIAPSGTSIGGVLYLTGTGFPEGVVSAPVGSIYIDKAITNGASSWIKKSGTGNTGWQVLEGDTGWRNINSLLGSFWQSGVGAFAVRRIGATVFVRVDGVRVAASPSGVRVALKSLTDNMWPAGFRNGSWGAYLSGASAASFPGLIAPMSAQSDIGVRVYGAGLSNTGNWTLDDYVAFQYQYASYEAWPTTLPGTAA